MFKVSKSLTLAEAILQLVPKVKDWRIVDLNINKFDLSINHFHEEINLFKHYNMIWTDLVSQKVKFLKYNFFFFFFISSNFTRQSILLLFTTQICKESLYSSRQISVYDYHYAKPKCAFLFVVFWFIDIIVVFFVEEKYVVLRLKKNLTRVQIIEFSFFLFITLHNVLVVKIRTKSVQSL